MVDSVLSHSEFEEVAVGEAEVVVDVDLGMLAVDDSENTEILQMVALG